MSLAKERLIVAYKRGYRVNIDGQLVGLDGSLNRSQLKGDYCAFKINYNGKKPHILVHRLMAYQKFGEWIFEKGIVVRHRNGISTDNSHENILIGTHKDNYHDRYFYYEEGRKYKIKEIMRNHFKKQMALIPEYVPPVKKVYVPKPRKKAKEKVLKGRYYKYKHIDVEKLIEFKKTHTTTECLKEFGIKADCQLYSILHKSPLWNPHDKSLITYRGKGRPRKDKSNQLTIQL